MAVEILESYREDTVTFPGKDSAINVLPYLLYRLCAVYELL